MFSKSVIEITPEQREMIRGKSSGMVYFKNLDREVNMSSVEQVMTKLDYQIEQADHNRGILHDGSRVVKRFGLWLEANDPNTAIDPKYYPEILQDKVPTIAEYEQKYAHLPEEKRLNLILGNKEEKEEISVEGLKKYKQLKGTL